MGMNQKHSYRDQATDGTEGGASGADTGTAQTTQATTETTLLGGAQAAAQQKPGDWIPEKLRVTASDGSLDMEASAKKLAESYSHLEQRLGSGDIPPATADEYQPEFKVDGVNLTWDDLKKDESMQSFVKGAHAKGITNAQLSYIMENYLPTAQKLLEVGGKGMTQEQAEAELRKDWAGDADFKAGVSNAYKAFMAYAAEGDKGRMDEIGNNPIVLRLLANIGRTLQEDTSVSAAGQSSGGQSVEQLMASEAYWDSKHPEHKAVSAKVKAHFDAKYGKEAVL